ncbi:MAG: methyltransferase domain-containing protein [Phycisphaeraceae bacterium]|nr:methyltransferase domain-containing protein [Phycisphaeraceae bacterium]
MAQNLSHIKNLLASYGLHPKKRLGQNFLHDANKMHAILAASELTAGQRVLEVGAGTGALTSRLLEAGANVLAVEVDRDMWPILDQEFANNQQLQVIRGDILKTRIILIQRSLRGLGMSPLSSLQTCLTMSHHL